MRITESSSFGTVNLVKLKDQNWLDKQRIAGKVVADTLSLLRDQIHQGTHLTYSQLNELGELNIQKGGCTPTFKGYKGFPAGVCISVNKQLVHGIPADVKPQAGDVISFDLGATYEGAIADSALTCIYGEPHMQRHVDLVKATEESLMRGIKAIKVGKRLGCIGNAIYKYARDTGYAAIINYGGHGLDWDTPHAPPFVANKSEPNEGIRIPPGLAIAIEPMLAIGGNDTYVSNDGWTVMTSDIGAHFEHSVFVHKDHVEIITWREGSDYPAILPFT